MPYNGRKPNPYTGGKNKRPAVTAANTQKYTDVDKKKQSMHGVGAKLFPKGTPQRAEQDAVAASKVKQYRMEKGEMPTYQSQVKHGLAAMPALPGQAGGTVKKKRK